MNNTQASSEKSSFLDLRKTTFCLLLKVIADSNINKEDQYNSSLIYYPIDRIVGIDSKEVSNFVLNLVKNLNFSLKYYLMLS